MVVVQRSSSEKKSYIMKLMGNYIIMRKVRSYLGFSVLYFPFDKQSCPFVFGFQNLPHTFGQLEILGAYLSTSRTGSQWNVTSISGNVTLFAIPTLASAEEEEIFSVAVFSIHLERDPNYYITTLIIPSTCLCLLAFMTFLAPPDSGERISVSVSMVLGMTVFQLLMFDLLPISNEQSLLSNYLSTNFILVTTTVPLSLMNINLAYGDRTDRLLKKGWFRVLTLELLPKILFVPSLSQRLPKNKVSPEKLTLEDVAGSTCDDETTEQDKKVTAVSPDRNLNKEDRDRPTVRCVKNQKSLYEYTHEHVTAG
ncbi:Neuronal acetylcholine receptor subunit alpha-9 [Holothuria leucospilota]|uniref:Neuronal acetylcholine receptor subunit alpha-9 n=1 Tax=Holothuria leucospilota TaxID=206669 RepID=A0A9Q1H4H2_HOLLE|nr:Neuronal acetylcholine receptor subunit alpha-9 [Holothuria leucospilota]